MLTQVAEWTPSTLLSLAGRNMTRLLPFNMVVTNVPGPQFPMYMLGARLLETFPHVPLVDNLGLGIALLSADGKLCWGFNADYDLVPDLAAYVKATRETFEELQSLAQGAPVRVVSRPAVRDEEPAVRGETPARPSRTSATRAATEAGTTNGVTPHS
jgi:hypothetical protein